MRNQVHNDDTVFIVYCRFEEFGATERLSVVARSGSQARLKTRAHVARTFRRRREKIEERMKRGERVSVDEKVHALQRYFRILRVEDTDESPWMWANEGESRRSIDVP